MWTAGNSAKYPDPPLALPPHSGVEILSPPNVGVSGKTASWSVRATELSRKCGEAGRPVLRADYLLRWETAFAANGSREIGSRGRAGQVGPLQLILGGAPRFLRPYMDRATARGAAPVTDPKMGSSANPAPGIISGGSHMARRVPTPRHGPGPGLGAVGVPISRSATVPRNELALHVPGPLKSGGNGHLAYGGREMKGPADPGSPAPVRV